MIDTSYAEKARSEATEAIPFYPKQMMKRAEASEACVQSISSLTRYCRTYVLQSIPFYEKRAESAEA